ncbi:MAG: 5-methyltetrahydropteroyltriglutamate--homocysteine S-methyltransferase [Bacteroidota bacterium]|nr:5-methyltetrahydropteroyltriglutamate--homocysteine S-methyltransferase [Bacteroidota bacterium]
MQTYAYGYPRLGKDRLYKRALEAYWKGTITRAQLEEALRDTEQERLDAYRKSVDAYPIGEFTLYDAMLDTAIMLGVYPIDPANFDAYFELARGASALPLSKWFNTNYHYLVPSLAPGLEFRLHWPKPLVDFTAHRAEALSAPSQQPASASPLHPTECFPYVIGPYTFARLSRGISPSELPTVVAALVPAYAELFEQLHNAGARYIHVDEPAFVLDVPEDDIRAITDAYTLLGQKAPLLVMTYYDSVDFLSALVDLPIAGIGVDLVHGTRNWEHLSRISIPADKVLIAGIVDGRNVWKTDLFSVAAQVHRLQEQVKGLIWLSNAGPLMHLPVSVESETTLDPALQERLAFAQERLEELRLLRELLTMGETESARRWNAYQYSTQHWSIPSVQERIASLRPEDFNRSVPYSERRHQQVSLPLLPTTTIGSFPQTPQVRQMRQAYRAGKISAEEYREFIRSQIKQLIALQEELGLDVFVHGEFERSDMVEFFAEKLDGIATTQHGWILSYGTRVYRPPIIYGDVHRSAPMTVEEITFAQSLTSKPVKGMLTGPVTILTWSYPRIDIPREQVAYQLALAINDEVRDLEAAGIRIIQIDEPAYREGAPLKRAEWDAYFRWASNAFKLAASAGPQTQMHTHMCYSDFTAVLHYIDWMDADVITIEAARSKGELLSAFERYNYARQIGPGVFDVHTPAVPSVESIETVLQRALRILPPEQVWVNPDCGLKTRAWEEVIPALRNMVQAAKRIRASYQGDAQPVSTGASHATQHS